MKASKRSHSFWIKGHNEYDTWFFPGRKERTTPPSPSPLQLVLGGAPVSLSSLWLARSPSKSSLPYLQRPTTSLLTLTPSLSTAAHQTPQRRLPGGWDRSFWEPEPISPNKATTLWHPNGPVSVILVGIVHPNPVQKIVSGPVASNYHFSFCFRFCFLLFEDLHRAACARRSTLTYTSLLSPFELDFWGDVTREYFKKRASLLK